MRISARQAITCTTIVAGIVAISMPHRNHAVQAAETSKPAPYTTWSDYLGNADSAQYSALKQINKTNVSQIEQVWFYAAGGNANRYGFNPLIVGNTDMVT